MKYRETIDPKSTKNVRWVAKLGSQAYATPVVAGGLGVDAGDEEDGGEGGIDKRR